MKTVNLLIAFLLLSAVGTGAAHADRGHVHFGLTVGPVWGPWYYGPPGYYPAPIYHPPVVLQAPAPQVYVQQQAAPAQAQAGNFWYYCAAARGYYPYVKECPGGWEQVSPQPSGQQQGAAQ